MASGYEQVRAFLVEDSYLFKHYFEGKAVFERVKPFYNYHQYRFEVPTDEFQALRNDLAEHGYEFSIVEDTSDYVVVVKMYTAHPDNIFKESIMQRSAGDHNFFLLKSQVGIEQAIAGGATRLTETDLANPF